jgi:hypothetical protein
MDNWPSVLSGFSSWSFPVSAGPCFVMESMLNVDRYIFIHCCFLISRSRTADRCAVTCTTGKEFSGKRRLRKCVCLKKCTCLKAVGIGTCCGI